MMILFMFLLVDIIVLAIIATAVKRSWLITQVCAFVISFAGVCCLALAIMSFQMHRDGLIEAPQIWLTFLWLILGIVGLVVPVRLQSSTTLIASACCLIAGTSVAFGLLLRQTFAVEIGAVVAMLALAVNQASRARKPERGARGGQI